ncbi:MAG TPA: ACP S-malonyltransferase [Mycobacteriales bacterium]|nr:ACP S-malonyltransferase [Mycobacteriales bacterium]
MPPRRTALVFPGQGSQRPGMGAPWRDSPAWPLVEHASHVSRRDLAHLLVDADAAELRRTVNAQLSTFLTSVLALHAVRERVDDVVALAGHSLGEVTALVAAGVLAPADGVRVVAERGAAMQAAADARGGTMAAVLGLGDEAVGRVVDGVEGVWVANHNAPAHVVVSGTADGVAAAREALTAAGARRVLPLPVGGAFHTPLMAPAQQRLDAALGAAAWHDRGATVLSAVTAAPYDGDWPDLLSRQLTAPVRWRQTVEALVERGVDTVVEVGPGGVLTGLVKRCAPGVRAVSVATPDDLEQL